MSLGMNSTIGGRFAGCADMQRRGHEHIPAEQRHAPDAHQAYFLSSTWTGARVMPDVGRKRPRVHMTQAEISGISPFFIVSDAPSALSFYRDRLGFEITFQEPADEPFFGIVRRGGAMIMLKDVGVDPLPNYKRERAARWDAYLYVPDPDALAAEFASRNVEFSEPLKDTHDGLRGFELKDSDGYVLFFGRPRS